MKIKSSLSMRMAVMAASSFVIGPALAQASEPAMSPRAQVAPLISNDIEGTADKEATLLMVTFPPGSVDPVHRHDALVYVYVLEGSIEMQVRGQPLVRLGPGQTFVEKPSDVHVVGRNASKTEPARFLAYFVKNKGVPPVLPAN